MALIAGMGISGSGKSSVFGQAAKEISAAYLSEPEEDGWPKAAKDSSVCGAITALLSWRCLRVPNLYLARNLADAGDTVFLDSFYDKLMSQYLGKPGLEWLIDPSDAYYGTMLTLASTDRRELPNCDALVWFDVSHDLWLRFLTKRGRQLDQHPGFIDSFRSIPLLRSAAEDYCSQERIPMLVLEQEWSAPSAMARKLLALLRKEGVLG